MEMKQQIFRCVTLAVVWSLLSGTHGAAQEPARRATFEGIVRAEFRSTVDLLFLELSVKQDRIRVEAEVREPGYTFYLIDYVAKKQYIMRPNREEYIEFPIPDVREGTSPAMEPAGFRQTDSTETIAGYSCDLLKVTFEGNTYDIWATKELGARGTFALNTSSFLLGLLPWQQEMLRLGYFPLRIVLDDGSGELLTQYQVTKIERKALNANRFRVPPEYDKTTLEALMPKPATQKQKSK